MHFIQAKICCLSDWLYGNESFTAHQSVASLVKKFSALSRTQYRGRHNSLLLDFNGVTSVQETFLQAIREQFLDAFRKIAKSDN